MLWLWKIATLIPLLSSAAWSFSGSTFAVRQHRHPLRKGDSTSLTRRSAASVAIDTGKLPRTALQELETKGYTVVPDFISEELQDQLRQDISSLRSDGCFKIAKIGQDSTKTLNTEIRVAETCFIDASVSKSRPPTNSARDRLQEILRQCRLDLASSGSSQNLDAKLDELLYAYYPQGGFYRRHVDALPGSPSILRSYSLLLYLNDKGWDVSKDGGQLRLHLDGQGPYECPPDVEPKFVDVDPIGGTLVLLKSADIPHEVMNTDRERQVVVGWYNRAVTAADISQLSEGGSMNFIPLAVAAGLVTVGLVTLLNG
mmetsp:Transcript_10018/g.14681  ORF Transcript_10018/g.14681 Transcript_10018/m.14681 type:complete len:314 (-) Transcript_10018:1438-2379(-)|eukprot:CAMPEP_0194066618 /NCGR_PEP_ID=MMETSP0009_2-20130614/86121_1 /TAXON_ID=210454 /ORGANISM="Grammatophora oceanica, Strain CCMP 410" /LENGTH=313 /DNA_ID=CAMNT_0038719589 /DNA_START=1035 /DNA_END=1976 /DNA_ORIENTATION=-